MFSLEQTKADLMESMGESRKRKDEIEVNLFRFDSDTSHARLELYTTFQGFERKTSL